MCLNLRYQRAVVVAVKCEDMVRVHGILTMINKQSQNLAYPIG